MKYKWKHNRKFISEQMISSVPGLKLHEGRNSSVWNFILCIFSSGFKLVFLRIRVITKDKFYLKWSCVWLFATLWTIQVVEFSRPEYWTGQPSPSPGDLPNPGIKPRSPAWQADSLPADPQGSQRILQYLNGPLFLSFKSLCTKPVIWWVNELPEFCESL